MLFGLFGWIFVFFFLQFKGFAYCLFSVIIFLSQNKSSKNASEVIIKRGSIRIA